VARERELKPSRRIDGYAPSQPKECSNANAKADAVALPPAYRLKIRHRKPWQNEGLYVDESLRRIAGRPARGACSSANLDRQQDGIEKRPLYTSGSRSSVQIGPSVLSANLTSMGQPESSTATRI
jgi:hypothetical protein